MVILKLFAGFLLGIATKVYAPDIRPITANHSVIPCRTLQSNTYMRPSLWNLRQHKPTFDTSTTARPTKRMKFISFDQMDAIQTLGIAAHREKMKNGTFNYSQPSGRIEGWYDPKTQVYILNDGRNRITAAIQLAHEGNWLPLKKIFNNSYWAELPDSPHYKKSYPFFFRSTGNLREMWNTIEFITPKGFMAQPERKPPRWWQFWRWTQKNPEWPVWPRDVPQERVN